MSFTININHAKTLDPGSYPAVLASVEEKDTKYGERLLWLFRVPKHGVEIAGFTSRSGSTQANAYDWAKTLNPAIANKGSWGPDDVVGKGCTLVVGVYQSDKGSKNRILEVQE